jgi:hypothetical protein
MTGVTLTIHDELTDITQRLTYRCSNGARLALIVTQATSQLAPGQHITSIDIA